MITMVNGTQYLPDELLPPSQHKDDVLTYLGMAHGDRMDGKRVLLLLQEEDDDLDVTGDDVEAVTQDPPVSTYG